MLRSAIALASTVLLTACSVDLEPGPVVDPELKNRIAAREASVQASDGAGLLELADMYVEAGRLFEAADTYERAKASGASPAHVHGGIARAYLELGYIKRSADHMRSCFEIDKNVPSCLYAFGRLMEQFPEEEARREARRAYRRLLITAPDHPKADYVRSALDQLDAALGPEQPPAGHPPGAGSQPAPGAAGQPSPGAASQPNGPAGAASQPAAGTPGQPTPLPGHGEGSDKEDIGELNPFGQAIMKAMAAVRNNDPVGAEVAYTEALKVRPNEPAALAGRAEARFAQNKPDAALEDINTAMKLHPDDPQVLWTYGLIHVTVRKDVKGGVAAWEKLEKNEPGYAKQLKIRERLDQMKKFSK